MKDRNTQEMIIPKNGYVRVFPGWYKVAVKVVDIFGNDTMTIIEVNV